MRTGLLKKQNQVMENIIYFLWLFMTYDMLWSFTTPMKKML